MIGKVISGRYQIIQNLGGGGFGQTFLAEDLQLPDHHKCVVKRLQPASSDTFVLEIASRLFETEARVLHKLGNHDRIPRLLAHRIIRYAGISVASALRGKRTREFIPFSLF